MPHDHAAYMRGWRAKQKQVSRAKILAEEHEWLMRAYTNSAGKGYSEQYRDGFKAAAGWVRLHSEIAAAATKSP